MKRSSFGAGDGLGEGDGDGDGDAVAVGEVVVVVVVPVVVGDGEAGVVTVGVVICCASTWRGVSHAARSANPVAMTTRATINNFSKARDRSVIYLPLR